MGVEEQHQNSNPAPQASAPKPTNINANYGNNFDEQEIYQDMNYENIDDVPLDYNFNEN